MAANGKKVERTEVVAPETGIHVSPLPDTTGARSQCLKAFGTMSWRQKQQTFKTTNTY
jgi:hypothetical protein